MKKLLIIAVMIAAIFLLTSGVALARDYKIGGTVTNEKTWSQRDYHIVFPPGSTVTTGTVTGSITMPDGTIVQGSWETTVATDKEGNTQFIAVPAGGGYLAPGQKIKVSVKVNIPNTYGKKYKMFWSTSGSLQPEEPPQFYNKAGSYTGLGVESYVQRSISISIADEILDFGRVKYGDPSTQSTTVTVSSNDDWDLYVSGESDLSVSRGDILDFLGVSLAGGADTGIGGLADGGFYQLITQEAPTVESFFDVFITLQPEPLTRPGYYKGYLDFNVIQDY